METSTVLFERSEILIAGLIGVDRALFPILHVEEQAILPACAGNHFDDL